MSLDSLMMVTREGIEHVRAELSPKEEWSPVMLIESDQEEGVGLVSVESVMAGGGMELFCKVAPLGLRRLEASAVVFVSVAYAATVDLKDLDGDGRPLDPDTLDKRESLVILGADRYGDTLGVVQEIERHDDGPPTLKDPMDLGGSSPLGPVVEALLRGVGHDEDEED